ncbi:aminoacrylate hydrolase [Tatumella morbirosei]|uniref:Putative carbamate hydrolase RutD n=1 Tax=Tatumella morbirosei TaxID=642227 RepID=A0A095T7U9_9GAMM|nr:pyrimidine utilization protein D [Tatumella morbirosei]KGD72971.1 aminoacrylate hydrolase [Tatumella morbirosei]
MQIQISGVDSANAPVVVLSAGLGGAAAFWKPQMAALKEKYKVVTYDQRGTGNNPDQLPENYSMQQMADELAAALDARGIDRYCIAGHALGGLIGLQLAASYPQRVTGVVVINGWLSLNAHTRRCFRVRQELLLNVGVEAFVRAQPLFLYPADWMADNQQRMEAEDISHAEHFQGTDNLLRRLNALMACDFTRIAPTLNLPVLVIYSQDDLLVPWTCSVVLADALPQSSVAAMARGGHAMSVTYPEEFNQLLLPWLEQHAA